LIKAVGCAEARILVEAFLKRAHGVYTFVVVQALRRAIAAMLTTVLDAPPALPGDDIFPCDGSFAPAAERA
jgi:hypothetical protein